jgi:hypothetical protein
VYLELPDLPLKPRHRRTSAWWRYGFPLALVLLVVAVPVLIWAGTQVVLQSNDGRLIPGATNASSPGWEAAVPPTSVMMVATINDAGGLSTVDLLTLTSDSQSNVVLIPADTQVTVGGVPETLVDAYRNHGEAGLRTAVETITGGAIGDALLANSHNWEDLVAPVGALTFDNQDDVVVNGVKQFPQGPLTVTPDRVGLFMESRNWAEDDTNRLLRQTDLWKAWLAKIAAKGASGVPGEVNTGIGKYLHVMAHQDVGYEVLPVQVHALTTAYAGVYLVLPQAKQLLGEVIPFPTAVTPGARPRVRVLDGTGRLNHGLAAAHNLTLDGAQIDSIGNASSFRATHTQFVVASENERAVAQKLRDAFGVGQVVVDSDADDSIDITIVLGADALGHSQAETTTIAPSGSSSSTATTGG